MALSLKKNVTSTRLNTIRDKQAEKQHLETMQKDEARLKEKEAKGAELKATSGKEAKRMHMRKARKLLQSFKAIKQGLPLQIGVLDELLARRGDVPAQNIRVAIRERVGKSTYLAKLAEGGQRYNLDGEPVGEITPEHQKYAAETYAAKQKEDE